MLDRNGCKKKRLEEVRETRKLRGERQQLKDTGLNSLAACSGESEDQARNREVEVFPKRDISHCHLTSCMGSIKELNGLLTNKELKRDQQ